jgi:GH15 family glucan-1,4-alpha-glucosidase
MAQLIEHHAIVGNLRTAALIGLDGAVNFLCWPQFDSPSIFASLLDEERGGSFELAPVLHDARHHQLYLPDTNVLLTRFLSPAGVAEISDFMTVGDADAGSRLVRRIKAVRGTMRCRMRCMPRFDYARLDPKVCVDAGTVIFTGHDNLALRLRTSVPVEVSKGAALAEFDLAAGESASFVVEDASHGDDSISADPGYVSAAFKETIDYWRRWVQRSTYRGRWREIVSRSALALKLLTSSEHGSIAAALTFGLPEEIGGIRNWDSRYTWLRDAAFTVYAFLRLGHVEEANAFRHWLGERAIRCSPDGTLHLMYTMDGRDVVTEAELRHLRGYRGSVPVCIGNAGPEQLQLDMYGALMDALYLSDKYGEQVSSQTWQRVTRSMKWLAHNWQRPDEGMWEMRGGGREFLYSRLMCWVAFDRAIRLARKRGLPAPLVDWLEIRDAIYLEIHTEFWDSQQGAFVQSKESTALDASCLLMPLVRFVSPRDPRWLSTLKAIGDRLLDDSLVYRYSRDAGIDGLRGGKGTFNMCTFWYVECLARAGDVKQARFLFEKMLGYANHVGLFSEELGPAGEHLGNFPQAFSHFSLISAAYYLDRALSGQGLSGQG